jgi:hypothetical protein
MTPNRRWWSQVLAALACTTSLTLGADRSVTAAEATGTYRHGKSEIKVSSAAAGKLQVEMNIVAPQDTGAASGDATIRNNVAVFVPSDTDGCEITMTFLPNGSLQVESQGRAVDCGFGRKAPPDGTYEKVSSAKPKFTAG